MDANPSVSTNGMEDEYDDEPEGEDDPYLIEGDEDGEGAARPVSNAGSSKAKANVLSDEYADDDDAFQVRLFPVC